MTGELKIPDADESGSSGDQQSADPKSEYLSAKWAGGSQVSDAMGALVASKSTAFGSESTSALIVASQRQAEFDKGLLTERNSVLERKIEKLRDDLEAERIGVSELKGKLQSQNRLRRARRLLTVLAGLAVSAGLTISLSGNSALSIAAFAAAIMCLLGSWFIEDKEGDV